MGTRNVTRISGVIDFYNQFNGHPSIYGKELANFLDGFEIVNGFTEERPKLANGMNCLAAQLVAHFKKETGIFYLYPPELYGYDLDYTYVVKEFCGGVLITVFSGEDQIFEGTPKELLEFKETQEK